MDTATRSPLAEQAAKLGTLARELSDGRLLEPVLRRAQTGEVWQGPIHDAFLNWLQFGLDGWVRNQLATGVRLVAEALRRRAEQMEQAGKAVIEGTATSITIPPPTPLNYAPGPPPPYGDIGGGPKCTFNPDAMIDLARLLQATADDTVIAFARRLRDALEPPPAPPPPPGAPPPVSPLPPDAHTAAGDPEGGSRSNAYFALADELHKAAEDISRRARALRLLDEPLPTTTVDENLVASVGAGAARQAGSSEAAEAEAAAPDAETATPEAVVAAPTDEKPPPTPEEIAESERQGAALAEQAIKDEVLDHPDKLPVIAEALEKHKDDKAFAAAFVERFGAERMRALPRTLQAWENNYTRGNPVATYNPPKRPLPIGEPRRRPKDTELEDILYSFSATLATATHVEGRQPLGDELRKLAHDETKPPDPLALSWLLSSRAAFETDFLIAAFDTCVKQVIVYEASQDRPFPEMGWGNEVGLSVEGDRRLDRNPKVAVLNAISRNPEAAARLQTEFQPFSLRHRSQEVRVDNISELLYLAGEFRGYGDNGSSMGRMLNAVHQGLLEEGKAADAQRFVEQLTDAATNDDEVERARSYLREIGLRHQLNDDQAAYARSLVERDPKHPARELLLGQIESNLKATADFVKDAAEGDKYTRKPLLETRAAWDVLKAAELAEGGSEELKNDAEITLDRTMREVAEGKDLTDEARRGMASLLALHIDDVAKIIGGDRTDIEKLEDEGLGVNEEQVRATLKELVKDAEALGILMSAFGAQVSQQYVGVADAVAHHLPARPPGMPEHAWRTVVADVMSSAGDSIAIEAKAVGEMFCEAADAVRQAGIEKREAAAAMLANYRLGVDIAFGFIKKAPGIGQVTGVIETAIGVVPNTKVQGFQDEVKSGIAEAISGIDSELIAAETKDASKKAREMLDRMVAENMMQALARDPSVLHRLEVTLPDGMLVNPGQPIPPPVGTPPRIPEGVLKPEFYDAETGGVLLPRPGSEDYKAFSKWYREPDNGYNSLYQAALNASAPVRDHMGKCMLEKLWDEAS